MNETDQTAKDILFWLSKSPAERLAAVAFLTVNNLTDSLHEFRSKVIEVKEIVYPLFRRLFHSLDNYKVEYLTVGGYAMAYFGLPRYRDDLDIWVNRSRENMPLLSNALVSLNSDVLMGAILQDNMEEGIIKFGTKPIEVDIHLCLGELDFDSAFAKREVVEISGIQIPFISKADFVVSKQASARIQAAVDGKIIQAGHGRKE